MWSHAADLKWYWNQAESEALGLRSSWGSSVRHAELGVVVPSVGGGDPYPDGGEEARRRWYRVYRRLTKLSARRVMVLWLEYGSGRDRLEHILPKFEGVAREERQILPPDREKIRELLEDALEAYADAGEGYGDSWED